MTFITIIIGRAAQFLIALALLRAATTLLSPEEMGKVSLTLTSIAFFAMFLVNPVGMFINRRLHAWQASGRARAYLLRYTGYLALVAWVAALSLPLVVMSGAVHFGIPTGWLVALVCGSLIFTTCNQTAIPSLNLLGESRGFVILTVATLVASLVCAVTLVEVIHPSAQYWVLGLLLGQALLAVIGTRVLFAKLRREGPPPSNPPLQKRHLKALFDFAWPVAIAAGLAWVQAQAYRYFMSGWLGLDQLGLFVAGYSISVGIVAGFESVLTAYFQPRLYRDANALSPQQQIDAWRRYASAVFAPLILTIALIVALAPELTRIFLGERFHSAASFVAWGALAEAARVLVGVYSLAAHVRMRTRNLVIPNIAGALLSLLLCSVLIPHWGAIGAGVALALSGFSVLLLMHFTLKLAPGRNLPSLGLAWIGIAMLLAAGSSRWLFAQQGWAQLITTICITGAVFAVFQFLFLRRYLQDADPTRQEE